MGQGEASWGRERLPEPGCLQFHHQAGLAMVGPHAGEQSAVTRTACDLAVLPGHAALHRDPVSAPHRGTIEKPHMKLVSPNMCDWVLSPAHP